jgi:hypothetical protein
VKEEEEEDVVSFSILIIIAYIYKAGRRNKSLICWSNQQSTIVLPFFLLRELRTQARRRQVVQSTLMRIVECDKQSQLVRKETEYLDH